jgi:hypothetical protein
MNKISTKRIDSQKNIENDNIREKIKFIIKKDKKYNLRDLSRTLKKMTLTYNNTYFEELLKFFLNNIDTNWLKYLM